MRYLHARLDVPAAMRHPLQSFVAESEAMNYAKLLAWNQSFETVQFALLYIDGDIDAYRNRIESVEPIRWFELAPLDSSGFYSYVCQEYTESERGLTRAFTDLQLVVVPPIVYAGDGWVDVTVVGSGGSLSDLVDALKARSDISVDVREIGRFNRRLGSVTGCLTSRQAEAVETATEMGYYAVPRQASLDAVASELEVANSTASELLRRAESRLMPRLVGVSGSSRSTE